MMRISVGGAACMMLAMAVCECTSAAEFPKPLPAESIPRVETLPQKYPLGWVFLNYAGDRIELRNVGADSREVKGNLAARDSSSLLISDLRPELYVADSAWSRNTRGVRTDYITVYDKQTLNAVGEIVLPGAKRALITALEGLTTFTDEQRMELVFNFTPASSVTVVDLINRKVLGEVEIPGCSLVYPTGTRGFSTLCASGTLLSVKLDANGSVTARSESKPFNPLDTDPLFTQSTLAGGIRYFPSLHGRIQPIDMRTDEVKILPDWPLVPAADAAGNWRPSGWQLIGSDELKLIYVLMQADAHEGSHKDPANEIWVYNVVTKQRVKRLRLVRPGSSLALTHGAEPLLLVHAGERLDVYDPKEGGLVRSMDLPGFRTRLQIDTVR